MSLLATMLSTRQENFHVHVQFAGLNPPSVASPLSPLGPRSPGSPFGPGSPGWPRFPRRPGGPRVPLNPGSPATEKRELVNFIAAAGVTQSWYSLTRTCALPQTVRFLWMGLLWCAEAPETHIRARRARQSSAASDTQRTSDRNCHRCTTLPSQMPFTRSNLGETAPCKKRGENQGGSTHR